MREIKFRAWDKEKKCWLSDVAVRNAVFEPHPQYAVMQFTGLLDKNGVEIYEGDILEYQPNDDGVGNVYDPTETWDRYLVQWKDRGFVAAWTKDAELKNRDNDGLNSTQDDIAVIGNIYENPELLK
jgi:uncharacterized phage protein (TIGR01671 family)